MLEAICCAAVQATARHRLAMHAYSLSLARGVGRAEGVGRPEVVGRPEGVGRPEDVGRPDGVGRPEGTAGAEGRPDGTPGKEGREEGSADADGRTVGRAEGRTGVGRPEPDGRGGRMLNDGRMLGRAGCSTWGKAAARLCDVSSMQ